MLRRTDMRRAPALALCGVMLCAGCGKTISRAATEQLIASDAVDRAVSQIDFSALAGQKVYFDTQYIQHVKDHGFVNAAYIISSLRQQMVAANCLLQEKKEEAEFIVEARVGTLGTDSTEMIYGVPANSLLTSASDVVPAAPTLPAIPELAVGKKNDQSAAAKIGVFAYNRQTREPVWQAGISRARSTSKDTWLLGAGPFQNGTIHDSTRFAGSQFGLPLARRTDESDQSSLAEYRNPKVFAKAARRDAGRASTGVTYVPEPQQSKPAESPSGAVVPAAHQQPADASLPASAEKPAEPAALPEAGAAKTLKFEWAADAGP